MAAGLAAMQDFLSRAPQSEAGDEDEGRFVNEGFSPCAGVGGSGDPAAGFSYGRGMARACVE